MKLRVDFDKDSINSTIKAAGIILVDVLKALEESRDDTAVEVKHDIQDAVPVLTGKLRRYISINKDGKARIIGHDRDKVVNESGDSYGEHVYYGIRTGYTIRPKSKKALRFYVGSKEVFAKSVYIPPRPGNPFVDNGIARSERGQVGAAILTKNLRKVKNFK